MKPYYEQDGIRVYHGDCREVVPAIGERFAAVITDPPYGLTAGKKGGSGAASVNLNSPYGRARIGTGNGPGGFMGKKWDGTGIEQDPAFWEVVLAAALPGAHLVAFGGSRTYHRIAVAIEDAGFEIRDTLQWLYGSGFPKSHNLKGEWQGWGTALKPAYEPIILARKPLSGTVAANVLAHGTGALNIDASRIGTEPAYVNRPRGPKSPLINQLDGQGTTSTGGAGRWPANVILDETAAAQLDQMSGERKSGGTGGGGKTFHGQPYVRPGTTMEPSTGGASRFFRVLPIDDPDTRRFLYTPKASRRERNAGLDGLPLRKTASDGYGSIQQPKLDRASPRENWTPHRTQNHHPTVKPLALMRWLLTLVTPPGGTVLDPFAGSGTTGVACADLGIPCVLIEQEAEYLPIIAGRIDHALDERQEREALPRQLSIAD